LFYFSMLNGAKETKNCRKKCAQLLPVDV